MTYRSEEDISSDHMSARRPILPYMVGGFTLLLLALLAWHMTLRPWSQDESRYILAAKFVRNGWLPYRDFAYFQMPLHPWLLAAWQTLFGEGLVWNRFLSLTAMALLVFGLQRQGTGGKWASLLILSSPLVWDYYVLVKPFALTSALALQGLLWCRRRPFLGGLLAGGATMIRALLGGAALAGAFALLQVERGARKRATISFSLGIALISSLVLFAWVVAGESFAISVFRPPAARHVLDKSIDWRPVFQLLLETLRRPAHFALASAFLTGVVFLAISDWRRRTFDLAWVFIIALLLTQVPTLALRPFYDENLSTAVPFAAVFLGFVPERISAHRRHFLSFIMLCTILLGSSSGLSTLYEEYRTRTAGPANSRANVARVGERIAAYTSPEDSVLSTWSGYPLAAGRPLPRELIIGLSALPMTSDLSEGDAAKYHLPTPTGLIRAIERKEAKLVVVGLGTLPGFEEVVRNHYRLREEIAGARLYLR